MKYERIFTIETLKGFRTVYELDDGSYVCADYSHIAEAHIDETMLFRCHDDGLVKDWSELWVTPGNTATNDQCIDEWIANSKEEKNA